MRLWFCVGGGDRVRSVGVSPHTPRLLLPQHLSDRLYDQVVTEDPLQGIDVFMILDL